MNIIIFLAALIVLCGLLRRFIGFAAQRPSDYAQSLPQFDVKTHLNGPMLCEGVLYGPMGRVNTRFVADMHGDWRGDRGTLREHFRYSSGTVQERCWDLSVAQDGKISAKADDIIGTAMGVSCGSSLCFRYRIRLAPEAGGHVLSVIDWMYLTENGTIINRSQFFKFSIKVAELVATIRKAPVS